MKRAREAAKVCDYKDLVLNRTDMQFVRGLVFKIMRSYGIAIQTQPQFGEVPEFMVSRTISLLCENLTSLSAIEELLVSKISKMIRALPKPIAQSYVHVAKPSEQAQNYLLCFSLIE